MLEAKKGIFPMIDMIIDSNTENSRNPEDLGCVRKNFKFLLQKLYSFFCNIGPK